MAKIYIDKSRYMEFIDDIATQLTELNFHDETFWYDAEQNQTTFTEDAQDFYNERYGEIETMLNETLNIYSYESKRNGKLSS